MNAYLEQSLMKVHQEEMVREVRTNHLAKRLRTERARSLGTARFSRTSLHGLRRVLSGQAAGV